MAGDNYLLYYSTIDLAANMAANRCGGTKMKRNLSLDESQAEKSRLRVPMKGQIQLASLSSLKFVNSKVLKMLAFSFLSRAMHLISSAMHSI